MSTTTKPCLKDLDYRGFIEGVTHVESSSNKELCHYFGGIPYACPPVGPYRWARPRPLPACYKYGTRANPGRYTGGAALCPQPGYLGPPNTKLWDENCLQLNVWVPVGEAPKEGWPVFFFIHGGWLQFGTPNQFNFAAMLSETSAKCIVVCPSYRLNLIGFLASRELQEEASAKNEPVGNYGLWDQRLAIEWCHKNVSYFGGNASNITLGGHSAGAYSTFHQLSYDLFQRDARKRLIKRAIMFSNGPGMQPKSLQEVQEQFDELLQTLGISLSLSSSEKLAKLRNMSPQKLLDANEKLRIHEFRAVSDDAFVRRSLFEDIDSGLYGAKMKEHGVEVMIGECKDENFVYGSWRPPRVNTAQGLKDRLTAEYPAAAVSALLPYYCPNDKLPSWKPCKDWPDAFGHVYADLQVHAMERGFVSSLVKGGAAELIHRYRIDWRPKCCDKAFPPEWGVTHGTDLFIWFWGRDVGLTTEEKKLVKNLVESFAQFVTGRPPNWPAQAPETLLRLTDRAAVDVWQDNDWNRGLEVWKLVREAQTDASNVHATKL